MSSTTRVLVRSLSTFFETRPAIVRRSQRVAARNATIPKMHFSAASLESLRVVHDSANRQFYTEVGDKRAFLLYTTKKDVIKMLHTEVPRDLGGRGLGKVLAKEALEYAVKNNLRIQINCGFVRHYVEHHDTSYAKYIIE